MRPTARLATAAVVVLAIGCGRSRDLSPPTFNPGSVECVACGMLVSDERFASALVFETPDGVQKPIFDDINCTLRHQRELPAGAGPATLYVRDFDSRAWLDAREAFFVHSERLETPMASHVAALGSREAAERLREQYPGSVVRLADLPALVLPPAPSSPNEKEDSTP